MSEDLIISDKEYREIQIITEDDELIVSITDEDIIVKDGYKVVCVPYVGGKYQKRWIVLKDGFINCMVGR